MRTFCSLLLLLLLPFTLSAQDYTTPDQFTFRVESDLVYGVDTNYLGLIDTLRLDLYTPNGNTDNKRPLAVFVHGGNWLGGCKDDPSGIVPLLHQFVKRGYVVASVNYRLGWQKDDFVSDPVAGWPISLWPIQYRSFYALDSAELKRAIYRGMQDVKGAIRWLKARADQDSVCVDKVFVGGESAGGFVAMATAFLDREAEKPAACNALPDALAPYFKTLNGTAFECVLDSFVVTGNMLARPDLGPVEGDLNINGFDASVKGVANFYGGVPNDAFALDWWQGVDTPSVYLYHQTCDGIVLFNRGQPISTISAYCNLGSTPWHYNYPFLFGSGTINTVFDGMTAPPSHITDFETCASFDPNFALFECNRYANNGSYHYTANHALRGQNLSAFWQPQAADADACLGMTVGSVEQAGPIAYPNPATDRITIVRPTVSGTVVCQLMSHDGRLIVQREVTSNGSALDIELPRSLANGTYMLHLVSGAVRHTLRVQVLR
ncbi:MAG: alpha/beta hydrolase fold domain-containing protein [Flavobacteriales bacterium]|nr:alpha/beta hydrolase fold domain-containing protein [Flavobacteriales bacterium]